MKLVTMKELLQDAFEKKYAVPAIDVSNMETINGLFEKASMLKSPIIVQLAPFQIEKQKITFEYISKLIQLTASRYEGKYAIHYDHGTELDNIQAAIDAGFTSVMYDGSKLPFEENVRNTQAARAIAADVTLEAELGVIQGGEGLRDSAQDECYTDPRLALEMLVKTGLDCLAVSIGNVHGFYQGIPKLNFNVLNEIHNKLNIPLVLHGASGLSHDDITLAIKNGVSKINFYTSVDCAFTQGLQKELSNRQHVLMVDYIEAARQEMMIEVEQIIRMCQSNNRL